MSPRAANYRPMIVERITSTCVQELIVRLTFVLVLPLSALTDSLSRLVPPYYAVL
jgi:hypothetical protein